jgi:hypothetical protein
MEKAAKERMSEGGKGVETFHTLPGKARDKIGAGAAHKKGRPKPPPQFQLTGCPCLRLREPTIGLRGHYLSDPSMSAAGRSGHFN